MSDGDGGEEERVKRVERVLGLKLGQGEEGPKEDDGAQPEGDFGVLPVPESAVGEQGRSEADASREDVAEGQDEVAEPDAALEGTVKAVLAAMGQEVKGVRELVVAQGKYLKAIGESGEGEKGVREVVERVSDEVRAYMDDADRRSSLSSGALRWAGLAALAVAAPGLLLAGAFVGQRWEVLPVEDATGGWRDHVWERYGGDVVACVRQGFRDGSSFECVLDVRASVEEARARASRR